MASGPIRQATALDVVLLISIALIWASAFVAIKIAVPETGPIWLATIRVCVGTLILLPYVMWRGMQLPTSGRQWQLLVAMSMLNVVIPFFLISWSGLKINAGVMSLLMGTGPFLALLGSHIFTDDDKITGPKLIGVLLGFTGILVLVGWDALNQLGTQHTLAQLAALGGSLCYVMAGLIIRRLDMNASSMTVLALSISSAMLIPLAMSIDGIPLALPSHSATAALLYLGVVPTGIAYMLRFYLIRAVGYATFAMSLNLIPVFGVFLGFLILSEQLKPQVLIALVLIVMGLLIARKAPKAKTPSEQIS